MKGDNNMEKNEILKYLYNWKNFTKLLEEKKTNLNIVKTVANSLYLMQIAYMLKKNILTKD